MKLGIILAMILVWVEANFTSEQLHPGIYFEDIGELKTFHSTWKIILNIDLKKIDSKINQLNDLIVNIQEICNDIEKTEGNFKVTSCEAIEVFGHDYLKKIYEERLNINDYLKIREKRGLINVLGTIFKELFGTMDQDDFDEIQKSINSNTENVKLNKILIKNQIQTIKHENEIMNKTIGDIEYNRLIIEKQTKKINEIIEKTVLNSVYNHSNIELDGKVNGLEALFSTMSSLLLSEISDIEKCVMDFKNGIINTKIFKMKIIIDNLRAGQEYLPEGLAFPFAIDNEDGANIIKSVVKIHTILDQEIVNFILEIPLVSITTYRMVKLYAIPTLLYENTFVKIDVVNNLMAVSLDKTKYYKLPREYDNICKNVAKFYICKEMPIYKNFGKDCIFNMYTNNKIGLKDCQVKSFKLNEPIIIRTYYENKIIVITPKKVNVNI